MKDKANELLEKIAPGLTASQKEMLLQQLADYVNDLLLHNFPSLVQLLYRVDVSEKKLQLLLKDHSSTDAGLLIANLLWQRQEEKIKAVKSNENSNHNIPDEERW